MRSRCGHAAQQRILGATADDVQCADRLAAHAGELAYHPGVFERQALEEDAYEGPWIGRRGLAGLTAEPLDGGQQPAVRGPQEPAIIGIHEGGERGRLLGKRDQLVVAWRL